MSAKIELNNFTAQENIYNYSWIDYQQEMLKRFENPIFIPKFTVDQIIL